MRLPRPSRQKALASCPGLLLAALACARPWLEDTMARHMGLELPGLFLVGWFAATCAGDSVVRRSAGAWNGRGMAGMLFALSVTAFWTVPAALDAAVLNAAVATAKVATIVAAGFLVRLSWRPAGAVIQAFFVLNWFWMTVFAGLVYQQAPQQLCSVYLTDQQAQTGASMVAWAVAGLAAWLWRVALDAQGSEAVPPPSDAARIQ